MWIARIYSQKQQLALNKAVELKYVSAEKPCNKGKYAEVYFITPRSTQDPGIKKYEKAGRSEEPALFEEVNKGGKLFELDIYPMSDSFRILYGTDKIIKITVSMTIKGKGSSAGSYLSGGKTITLFEEKFYDLTEERARELFALLMEIL